MAADMLARKVFDKMLQELEELMDSLNLTNPHFIHCLKPNLLNFTDKSEEVLIHQLKCGGVLEAARISLKGRRKLMREKKNRDAVQIQERLSNIYSTMENIDRRLAQIENNMDDKRTSNSYEEQLSIFQSTLAQIETAISHEKPTAKSFDTSLVFTAMQIATTVGVVFPLILPVYPPTNIIQKLFVAGCYGFLASAAAVFVKLIQIINSFQLSEPSEIRYASNLTVATYIFVGIELFTVLAYVSILGVVVGAIFFF